MKFTLTFEGALKTSGAKADFKHFRRRQFHQQLKRLWSAHSLLANWHLPINQHQVAPAIEVLAKKHAKFGAFEFVPLVSKDIAVETALYFHILRPTTFKGRNADPDNIVKILVDSLKMPQAADELPKDTQPQQGETPFFVLMQDDGLLSKITSVSDELLQPILGKDVIEPLDTRVLIDVYIRPNFPLDTNLIFFSDDFDVWNHQWTTAFDGIRNWSNAELRTRTTQCVLRMRVTSSNFMMQRSGSPAFRTQHQQSSEDERQKEWYEFTERMQRQSHERQAIWDRGLRPVAMALKEELQRRIFGAPPYPKDQRSYAIDDGMLAGVDPIGDAAAGLESLIRQLP